MRRRMGEVVRTPPPPPPPPPPPLPLHPPPHSPNPQLKQQTTTQKPTAEICALFYTHSPALDNQTLLIDCRSSDIYLVEQSLVGWEGGGEGAGWRGVVWGEVRIMVQGGRVHWEVYDVVLGSLIW